MTCSARKRTLSPGFKSPTTLASATRNTMVMGGISRFLISPCLSVRRRGRGSQRVISPSLSSACAADGAGWWLLCLSEAAAVGSCARAGPAPTGKKGGAPGGGREFFFFSFFFFFFFL